MTFWTFLIVGTLLMVGVMLIARLPYRLPVWKTVIAAVLLTFAGYAGAKLMAFIEAGTWSGRSFYGALFFAPILMVPVAWLLRVRTGDLLDMCAPAECVMLAMLKVNCALDGCCYGYLIRIDEQGNLVRFPSQIVECVTALLLMLVLLWMTRKEKFHGSIYPWYMLLYGVLRFGLNLLRETEPFIWGLPAGNFWSLISAGIGLALLLIHRRQMKAEKV